MKPLKKIATMLNSRLIPIFGFGLITIAVLGGLEMQLARGEIGRGSLELSQGTPTNDVRLCLDDQLTVIRYNRTVTLIVFPYHGSLPVSRFETTPTIWVPEPLELTAVYASTLMTVLHGSGRVDSPLQLHVQRAVYRQFVRPCRAPHSTEGAATTTF